jgi:hypothetical protein
MGDFQWLADGFKDRASLPPRCSAECEQMHGIRIKTGLPANNFGFD